MKKSTALAFFKKLMHEYLVSLSIKKTIYEIGASQN